LLLQENREILGLQQSNERLTNQVTSKDFVEGMEISTFRTVNTKNISLIDNLRQQLLEEQGKEQIAS
jgi:hypothetical protein